MSIPAGSLLHVGGKNVIDRLQSAGLGDVNLPIETIRETGNREVVDKVVGEPDFTFSMESYDCSTEPMAWLTGGIGAGVGSAQAPGDADPEGTPYSWLDAATQCMNIISPWKDATSGSAGTIEAGVLIPGYYPIKLNQRYGVTDNSTFTIELGGGSFFYAKATPEEDFFEGNGSKEDFETNHPTIHYRKGGVDGTTFRDVFGVIVNGDLQTEDVDYVVTGGNGSKAKIEFTVAPPNKADIRCCYFTSDAKAYPQTVHPDVVVKPGAVRGRNIRIVIEGQRAGNGQSFELEASVEGEVEREMGNEEIVGRTVNGTDVNGTFTVRSKDSDAFFALLKEVTGVEEDEVYGWFNDHTVSLDIEIENPKNPGKLLKTIRIDDAKFQPPGTPARVNQPTDFAVAWSSVNGNFTEFKGEAP
jgi:hypothetical protein